MKRPEVVDEHLRAILDALPVGVCSRDRERRIVHLNRRAEELSGYRAQDVRGEPCAGVLCHGPNHAGNGEAGLCAEGCPAGACLEEGTSSTPLHLSLKQAEGGRLAVVSRFSPLRDSAGDVVGFVETFEAAPSAPAAETDALVDNGLQVDQKRRTVRCAGREVRLTRTEFDLLACLARRPGQALSHGDLLREVWGPECEGQTQYLHTFIAQIRRKLEPNPRRPSFVVTEPRYGYRLVSSAPRSG